MMAKLATVTVIKFMSCIGHGTLQWQPGPARAPGLSVNVQARPASLRFSFSASWPGPAGR